MNPYGRHCWSLSGVYLPGHLVSALLKYYDFHSPLDSVQECHRNHLDPWLPWQLDTWSLWRKSSIWEPNRWPLQLSDTLRGWDRRYQQIWILEGQQIHMTEERLCCSLFGLIKICLRYRRCPVTSPALASSSLMLPLGLAMRMAFKFLLLQILHLLHPYRHLYLLQIEIQRHNQQS